MKRDYDSTVSEVRIITNNHPREILDGGQLTVEERKDFDYIDWEAVDVGRDSVSFIRYKGELYDLNDTEGTCPWARAWFYRSDSFFSGVLFRYAPNEANPDEIDPDYIICGRYLV